MVLNELLVFKIWFWKYGFNLRWISQAGNRKFSTQCKWAKDERKNSLQTEVAQNCPKCSILFKDLYMLDLIGKLFSIRMVIENKRVLKDMRVRSLQPRKHDVLPCNAWPVSLFSSWMWQLLNGPNVLVHQWRKSFPLCSKFQPVVFHGGQTGSWSLAQDVL